MCNLPWAGLLLSCMAIQGLTAQEVRRTEAQRATVQVVTSGVFPLAEGYSIFIEEKGVDPVFIAFPKRSNSPRKGAYWPGPVNSRQPCEVLKDEEFELVVEGQNICVRLGLQFSTLHDIGEPTEGIRGGCWIYVVRVERAEPPAELILRAVCEELKNVNSWKN
jgi:hypothetical protein